MLTVLITIFLGAACILYIDYLLYKQKMRIQIEMQEREKQEYESRQAALHKLLHRLQAEQEKISPRTTEEKEAVLQALRSI